MARLNNPGSGMGYVGYQARVFYEMTNYGRGTQSHVEKMVILEKIYSHLLARLPVMYGESKKEEDQTFYLTKILPRLEDVYNEIEVMNEYYQPAFEGEQSCSDEEKIFCKIMRGVYERLDQIIAMTHLIDNVKPESEEVIF